MGSTLRTPRRWLGDSMAPPVPMTEPVENRSSPESTASAVVSITSSRATSCAAIFGGSTCTCIICSRSPQSATLATPGTASSRARIVQYAVIDIWIREWSFDVIPICIARPVAETGASMTGGAAQVGRVALTAVIRSWTSCRACSRSTSGLKISSMADSWGTDLERSVQTLDPVERLLERHGHQGLDVGGRQSEARGLDDDPGRCELREDVDARGRQVDDADPHHEGAERHHQEPVRQARRHHPPHERPARGGHHSSPLIPASAPTSSDAPTMTTSVPAGGPEEQITVSPSIEVIVSGTRR